MTVFMTYFRSLLILLLTLFITPLFLSQAVAAVRIEIFQPNPTEERILDSNEHFYLGIEYESDVPIRFLPAALRLGKKREVGARTGRADLHASGKGKALTWIAFDNPTHIDEVVISAYDEEWTPLATESITVDARWSDTVVTSPREPEEWVKALQKNERVKRDYLFDSEPKKPEVASDALLILALLSIPLYIFLQIRMLRRYRLRWRELATVPLITALPLTMYAFGVGIGFNLRLWPPFIMYFSLFACGYLVMLWTIKKIKE
jgi:hypothetical protein